MVSRRNFFSMFVMMMVLLFLFQVPEVVKENQSDYDVNAYISEERLYEAGAWEQEEGGIDAYEDGDFIVFFGDAESRTGRIVEQWCVYTKRNLLTARAFEDYSIFDELLPEAVLVDSSVADPVEGISYLQEIASHGITLIFCNLPEAERLRGSRRLLELLGIQSIREEAIETEGVRLFGNLFLGGEAFYIADKDDEEEQKRQDFELNVPWYIMRSGTKTYMVATLDELLGDEEAKNELFPSLIWRNVYEGAQVFAVNGDYLERTEGIGILDGMMYEASAYSLYPVVNAQNVSVVNFPSLAGENDERVRELYSRNTRGVIRDICWPALSALAGRSHYELTCLFALQFDYADGVEPDGGEISFYLQQFKEFSSEAGISLDSLEATDFAEKLIRDDAFMDSLGSSYSYSAFFARERNLEQLLEAADALALFTEIRTVASEYQENGAVVSYCGADVTRQNMTADAITYNYSDDLRVRSLETALGYSNVMLNMYPVIWPETEEDQWEKITEKFTSNLNTYWRFFTAFDRTTLSESDERIRTFLNLDYRQGRVDDTIYLELSGTDEGWFILRTHGEDIVDVEGGAFERIEKEAYLIHAQEASVEIQVKSSHSALEITMD